MNTGGCSTGTGKGPASRILAARTRSVPGVRDARAVARAADARGAGDGVSGGGARGMRGQLLTRERKAWHMPVSARQSHPRTPLPFFEGRCRRPWQRIRLSTSDRGSHPRRYDKKSRSEANRLATVRSDDEFTVFCSITHENFGVNAQMRDARRGRAVNVTPRTNVAASGTGALNAYVCGAAMCGFFRARASAASKRAMPRVACLVVQIWMAASGARSGATRTQPRRYPARRISAQRSARERRRELTPSITSGKCANGEELNDGRQRQQQRGRQSAIQHLGKHGRLLVVRHQHLEFTAPIGGRHSPRRNGAKL